MKVLLCGTCNGSQWREKLIPMLKVEYINPVIDEKVNNNIIYESIMKDSCDVVLYVLTPAMTGYYSIAEVIDASNKYPEKLVVCVLDYDFVGRCSFSFKLANKKSIQEVLELVTRNGGLVLDSLEEVAKYLNNCKIPMEYKKIITSRRY